MSMTHEVLTYPIPTLAHQEAVLCTRCVEERSLLDEVLLDVSPCLKASLKGGLTLDM